MMGLTERWNKFAKKKIYINDTLEIRMGRLVFSFIIMLIEFIQAYAITGNPAVFWALLLTLATGLKHKKNKIQNSAPNN